jgi:hypothetical protein
MRLGLGLCLVFLDYVLGYLPGSRCLLIVLNRSFSAGCLTCLLDYLPVAFAFIQIGGLWRLLGLLT